MGQCKSSARLAVYTETAFTGVAPKDMEQLLQ